MEVKLGCVDKEHLVLGQQLILCHLQLLHVAAVGLLLGIQLHRLVKPMRSQRRRRNFTFLLSHLGLSEHYLLVLDALLAFLLLDLLLHKASALVDDALYDHDEYPGGELDDHGATKRALRYLLLDALARAFHERKECEDVQAYDRLHADDPTV